MALQLIFTLAAIKDEATRDTLWVLADLLIGLDPFQGSPTGLQRTLR